MEMERTKSSVPCTGFFQHNACGQEPGMQQVLPKCVLPCWITRVSRTEPPLAYWELFPSFYEDRNTQKPKQVQGMSPPGVLTLALQKQQQLRSHGLSAHPGQTVLAAGQQVQVPAPWSAPKAHGLSGVLAMATGRSQLPPAGQRWWGGDAEGCG